MAHVVISGRGSPPTVMKAVHGARYASPKVGGQVALEGDKEEEMEFQDAKMALKVVYNHSNFDSSTDERR
jgi:hypothetical protein